MMVCNFVVLIFTLRILDRRIVKCNTFYLAMSKNSQLRFDAVITIENLVDLNNNWRLIMTSDKLTITIEN